jgi:molecular chaperone GrpE
MVEGAEGGPAEGTEPKGMDEASQLDSLQREVDSLKKELLQQKAMADQYLDLAKRIQADFDNYRKRAQREREENIRSANDKLILDLLGILDDLERALAAPVEQEELSKGIGQVRCNLLALLKSYGLEEMPGSERFDPRLHEALDTTEGEEGRIYETYQKGYLNGTRVIRYAKVKVGKNTEGEKDG